MANTTPSQQTYLPGTHPDLPPPVSTSGVIGWARSHLFSSPLNIILTLLCAGFLWIIIPPLLTWGLFDAVWQADSRKDCWAQMDVPEGGDYQFDSGYSAEHSSLSYPWDYCRCHTTLIQQIGIYHGYGVC